MVDICGYQLPTNLQNFTQKDLNEVKIFQKVLWGLGATFLKHPVCVWHGLRQSILTKFEIYFQVMYYADTSGRKSSRVVTYN